MLLKAVTHFQAMSEFNTENAITPKKIENTYGSSHLTEENTKSGKKRKEGNLKIIFRHKTYC